VEAHDYLANLQWNRLDGAGILGVVRSHWGIENNGVQTLDMDWEEERAWCTIRAATDVLGLLRWWAYNWVGLLKGRDLRAPRYRVLTRFCGVGRAGQCMGRGRAAHSPGGAGRLRWRTCGRGDTDAGATTGRAEPPAGAEVCPCTAAEYQKALRRRTYAALPFVGKVWMNEGVS
jgi:hypothetical protein